MYQQKQKQITNTPRQEQHINKRVNNNENIANKANGKRTTRDRARASTRAHTARTGAPPGERREEQIMR